VFKDSIWRRIWKILQNYLGTKQGLNELVTRQITLNVSWSSRQVLILSKQECWYCRNKKEDICMQDAPVEMRSAWPVGLMLAFAHGSILTLASWTRSEDIVSKWLDTYYRLRLHRLHLHDEIDELTVGIAEATVATAAALAPASVASASRHVPKHQYVYKAIDQTSQTCTQARRRVFILRRRCVHVVVWTYVQWRSSFMLLALGQNTIRTKSEIIKLTHA
jgi:hypothetical protein